MAFSIQDQADLHKLLLATPSLTRIHPPRAFSLQPAYQAKLCALQVSGLPTNQAFLKRLAAHPAFIAAELDTSFIQKHHASLVDSPPLHDHVIALAAVADHMLQVQEVSRKADFVMTHYDLLRLTM